SDVERRNDGQRSGPGAFRNACRGRGVPCWRMGGTEWPQVESRDNPPAWQLGEVAGLRRAGG
ncbi:MAG: hypothetical protein ACKOFW_20565, partial [Planctomycetaceae bacterium]